MTLRRRCRKSSNRRHTRSTARRKVRGGSVWSWIRGTAMPWIKKNKIISKYAGMLGPYGKMAASAAGALGWGRHRGGSMITDVIKKHATLANLKKLNTIARNKRYISRGLFKFGKKGSMMHTAGKAAHALGYGRGGSLGYGRGCQKKYR